MNAPKTPAIKPGDAVRLLLRGLRCRSARIPADGLPGTVIKVGRRYATAAFGQTDSRVAPGEVSFDMETGFVRGDTEGLCVRTTEQIDRDERRKEAIYLLGLIGLEFKVGYARFLTLEQLEALAEVVKTWDRQGGQ